METQGEGFTVKVEGKKMVITVDLSRQGSPSKSGKSLTIATSRGNMRVGDVSLGLNVYRPNR